MPHAHGIVSDFYTIPTCRYAYFTTESLNLWKNTWLMCLMQSLGKYILNCYASESQLQQYTSGKLREFMAQPTGEDEWAIKIAVKAVGLQEVNAAWPITGKYI